MRPLPHVRGTSARAASGDFASERPRTVRGSTLALLLAIVAALSVATLPTPAVARDDINKQVNNASDDVAAANKSVARAAAQLRDATAALPAAQAAAASALQAYQKAQAQDRIVEAELERATTASLRSQQQLDAAQARIDAMHARVDRFASQLYMEGPLANLAVILEAQDPTDFAASIHAVDSASKSNLRTFADLNAAKADFALKSAQADALQAQVLARRNEVAKRFVAAQELQANAAAAKARVDALVRARGNALGVAKREKARVLAEYRALKAEQDRARAASQSPGGWDGPPPSGDWFWPIPGAGISAFVGPRIHPVYGYRSCHTGVDIRGWYGTSIHSPQPGIVIAIQSGGPYGLHTFISHGNGLVTMYAHQSHVSVRVGERVAKGEIIGEVGSSGWVTGPHLHFEIHVNGVPFDPLGWYGGRKVKVSCA